MSKLYLLKNILDNFFELKLVWNFIFSARLPGEIKETILDDTKQIPHSHLYQIRLQWDSFISALGTSHTKGFSNSNTKH